MKYNVEYTDTFGGEANYSWVKRATIEVPEFTTQSLVMRRAKAAMGLTGVRGRVEDYAEHWKFKPYNSCTVMFVTIEY